MAKPSPPAWATGEPLPGLELEIHKNGELIKRVDLGAKPFCLLGRKDHLVDILMAHWSISRIHAALARGTAG